MKHPLIGPRNLAFLAAALVALLHLPTAGASGLNVAKFGGEHGHPTTDNLSAVYYNPAGLALGTGTRLMIDATLAHRTASFERARPDVFPIAAGDGGESNYGKAELSNDVASPFIAFGSDLGVPNLGVALAFFVPVGGSATWDDNDIYSDTLTKDDYPGAIGGVNRWWSIDGSARSLFLSSAVAYRLPDVGLSFGLALNGIKTEIHSLRARNDDGSDDLVQTSGSGDDATVLAGEDGPLIQEGRALLDVSGFQWSLGLGVIYEPPGMQDTYIGLSYQSRPNLTGGMELEGDLSKTVGGAPPRPAQTVIVTQDWADVMRLGVRTRPTERLEIRASGEVAFWSALERQCIADPSLDAADCDVNPDGSAKTPEAQEKITANIERGWENAFGFKVGVSWWLTREAEVFLGGGYDGSAIPDATLDPAIFDMAKQTLAVGGRYSFSDAYHLALTVTQVLYDERDTTGKYERLGSPSAGPDAGGVYNQSITVANVTIEAGF
jgi:long-chain fatty acid transport protein